MIFFYLVPEQLIYSNIFLLYYILWNFASFFSFLVSLSAEPALALAVFQSFLQWVALRETNGGWRYIRYKRPSHCAHPRVGNISLVIMTKTACCDLHSKLLLLILKNGVFANPTAFQSAPEINLRSEIQQFISGVQPPFLKGAGGIRGSAPDQNL